MQPWDKSLVKAVSRAIQVADLGLNPTDDGTRRARADSLLTEERRKDMVKLVSKLAEEGRVHVRQVRHDINKDVKHRQDGGEISEDDAQAAGGRGAEAHRPLHRAIIDELLKKKTAEVMEVWSARDRRGQGPMVSAHPEARVSTASLSPEELRRRGNLPKHIAIIMDGNGRWARQRGVARHHGPSRGARSGA